MRDEHDAQDVVQDAALRAFRHIASRRDEDARAWLLAIVRNCCYTWLNARQADRARRAEPGAEFDVADPRGADELAMRTSEQARVESALARLPLGCGKWWCYASSRSCPIVRSVTSSGFPWAR
jgi:RNA polymerase sigma-70 factor (ECF subfamily)